MRHVVGVPPLHFEIHQRGAGPPRHRDAVAGHFARAGRARVQAVGVAGRENDGACEHDDVGSPVMVIERENAAHAAVRPAQERGRRGLLQQWRCRL